jgi:hypothetical protein
MNFVDVAQLAVFLGPDFGGDHWPGLVLPQTSVDPKKFQPKPETAG